MQKKPNDDDGSPGKNLPVDPPAKNEEFGPTRVAGKFIDWNALRNLVLGIDGWSIKDPCMAFHGGWFYLFFSTFYHDDGRERSHVACVKTRDLIVFSEPLFD